MSAEAYSPTKEQFMNGHERNTKLPQCLLKQLGHTGCLSEFGLAHNEMEGPLQYVRESMYDNLIGQREAIDTVTAALASRTIREDSRPIASFIFLGPTGVGKTEFAKELSNALNEQDTPTNLVRLDCSQLTSQHEVSSFLLGSPAGYVGYKDAPFFSQDNFATQESEHATILLLDELEKADDSLFRTLLPVLDEGNVTLRGGSTTDFSNTIIIATSNVGANEMSHALRTPLGFGSDISETQDPGQLDSVAKKALQERFKYIPEFLGRITKSVVFEPHTAETLRQVLDRTVERHDNELFRNRLGIDLTPQAKSALVDASLVDSHLGARPLINTYDQMIRGAVGTYQSNGSLRAGKRLIVCHESDFPDEEVVADEHGLIYFVATDSHLNYKPRHTVKPTSESTKQQSSHTKELTIGV